MGYVTILYKQISMDVYGYKKKGEPAGVLSGDGQNAPEAETFVFEAAFIGDNELNPLLSDSDIAEIEQLALEALR